MDEILSDIHYGVTTLDNVHGSLLWVSLLVNTIRDPEDPYCISSAYLLHSAHNFAVWTHVTV